MSGMNQRKLIVINGATGEAFQVIAGKSPDSGAFIQKAQETPPKCFQTSLELMTGKNDKRPADKRETRLIGMCLQSNKTGGIINPEAEELTVAMLSANSAYRHSDYIVCSIGGSCLITSEEINGIFPPKHLKKKTESDK